MSNRTLFIDADACPVKSEAISIARSLGWQVMLVGNTTQNLEKFTRRNGVEAVTVGVGRDAADFAIIELLKPQDVVVTADLGVAAMALGRGARVVGFRGRVFTAATIDMELEVRHAEQRFRRAGGRTGGPSALEDEDREHFSDVLERVLRES